MPKAKSVMWALQEEFDDKQNKIYFQVIPNTSSQVSPEITIKLEKYKMKEMILLTLYFCRKLVNSKFT